MYQALRRGIQSVADDAAARGYANHLRESFTRQGMPYHEGMSAKQIGQAFPRIQEQANQFADEFLSNVKPITEDGFIDSAAHFVGRKGIQAGQFLTQNPSGQMALFSAPMLAPMFMSGGEQQQELSDVQIAYLQQQQMMQQRGYQ